MSKTVKVENFPRKIKINVVKKFFDGFKVSFIKMDNFGRGTVEFKTSEDAKKATALNMTTFKKKEIVVRIFNGVQQEKEAKPEKRKFDVKPNEEIIEGIMDTGRLYLRYLNYSVTEAEIVDVFKQHGELVEVHLPYDHINKRNKGFGYVTFVKPSEAVNAYKALNNTLLKDRKMHIMAGAEKPDSARKEENDEDYESKTAFQAEKQASLRASASSCHNWNALFVNSDSVAEYLAMRLGLTRSELFNGDKLTENVSMAVRLAQAETQLVLEMRTFLENAGVRLDRLDGLARPGKSTTANRGTAVEKRGAVDFSLSSTTFLVKNLAPGVTKDDLERVFKRFDGLTNVLMPPHGATAIVTYGLSQQAKTAYMECAYMSMGDGVLMLQWAPADLLTTPEGAARVTETGPRSNKLVVKNLPFQATQEELQQLFDFPGLENIRMVKKDNREHRGFAFLIFDTEDHAQVVKETMGTSTHLLNRKLIIEYSIDAS